MHNCGEFGKTLENGAQVLASMDKNGVVWTAIEVPANLKGQGIGKSLFGEAFDKLGTGAKGIGGKWTYGDNLAEFNKLTAGGLSPEEAAKLTFTGKQAMSRGFGTIGFDKLVGTPGNYTNVQVIFGK